MDIRLFARRMQISIIAGLAAVSLSSSHALAQDDHGHDHAMTAQQPQTAEQQKQASALVSAVRDATAQFQTPATLPPGYALKFGCVSGSGDEGAMGLHFVNESLVFDGGKLDVTQPEVVLYEPLPNGGFSVTGADYLVLASDWDPKNPNSPPQLMGQLFHYFDAPNRFGLPPFYTLHVWAWKENPNGSFTNWNPTVSCEAFSGQN